MDALIGTLLKTAGFQYHEMAVIERIKSYLSQNGDNASSLGTKLFFLHQAAKEWTCYNNNGDKECNFFLTLLSFDRNSLCVVTQLGEPVVWLNLCIPSLPLSLYTKPDSLER